MPELPEVETLCRAVRKLALGRRISEFVPLRSDYVKTGLEYGPSLAGQTIESAERKGKIIALHCSNEWVLLHHLGMTGRLLLVPAGTLVLKHTHLRIPLSGAMLELRQWDPRRFGYTAILPSRSLPDFGPWKNLGIDPFELRIGKFMDLLGRRKQPLKSFLLDQRHIAGLGNIYADESLFRAGIHPARLAGSLSKDEACLLLKQIRKVLRESIQAGGSTTHDFQTLDGSLGEFQHKHRVYRKTGEACRHCGTIIQRMTIGGRSTHCCPSCQV